MNQTSLAEKKNQFKKKTTQKIKSDKTQETKSRIKNLSIEIKSHFNKEKKIKVGQGIKPGNNKTLWDAVKIEKDQNTNELPDQMKLDETVIPNEELAEQFACMFEKKIKFN